MRLRFQFRAAVGVLVCGVIATGCSRSPTDPSQSRPPTSPASSAAESSIAQQAGLSIEGLEARGWDCQPAPLNPTRVTCSHPNQVHPVLLPGPTPPADRPAAITLLVFDNGAFTGTDLLIRSDLYKGQTCRSTGDLYRFLARIGYYECLHQPAS